MVANPPEGKQWVMPYLSYADADAAIAFLCEAYGFEEVSRMPMPDGRIGHAELSHNGGVIMLASVYEELGQASPKDLPGLHARMQCYVDDVDAHFERAKAAGATILSEPEDQFYGDRMYRTKDIEGHEWFFATHIRDVPMDEMVPPEM